MVKADPLGGVDADTQLGVVDYEGVSQQQMEEAGPRQVKVVVTSAATTRVDYIVKARLPLRYVTDKYCRDTFQYPENVRFYRRERDTTFQDEPIDLDLTPEEHGFRYWTELKAVTASMRCAPILVFLIVLIFRSLPVSR